MSSENSWFIIAVQDFEAMQTLHREGHHRQTCFFAQQTCEKLLKGSIQESEKHPPKTHELTKLLEISGEKPDVDRKDVEFLSGLYIDSRYPEDIADLPTGEPDAEDAERSVNLASAMLDYFKGKYGF